MNIDDMILVSVDDHLVEPGDMFDGFLPSKYADVAPRMTRLENGCDAWIFDGRTFPNVALNAVAGRPKEEYGIEPTAFEQMRPGCYDPVERIKDMNAAGLLASMCFPSFPGFSGRLFADRRGQGPRARDRPVVQRLAHRRMVRVRAPAATSRWRSRCSGTRSLPPPKYAASPARASIGDLHREPGHARLRQLPQPGVGPVLGRRLRRRPRDLDPPRLVGLVGRHRRRRADRRDDHAPTDEHLRRPRPTCCGHA